MIHTTSAMVAQGDRVQHCLWHSHVEAKAHLSVRVAMLWRVGGLSVGEEWWFVSRPSSIPQTTVVGSVFPLRWRFMYRIFTKEKLWDQDLREGPLAESTGCSEWS